MSPVTVRFPEAVAFPVRVDVPERVVFPVTVKFPATVGLFSIFAPVTASSAITHVVTLSNAIFYFCCPLLLYLYKQGILFP